MNAMINCLLLLSVAVSAYRPIYNCYHEFNATVHEVEHTASHYFTGGPYAANSLYGTCNNGTLSCFLDDGIADAPQHLDAAISCDFEEHQRRRLGVVQPEMNMWPDATLCYAFPKGVFDQREHGLVADAIQQITDVSCVKIISVDECKRIQGDKPCNGCEAYVNVIKDQGCYSLVGYQGKPQSLSLATSCFNVGYGTVMHEFLHALGMRHEHTHPASKLAGLVVLRDNIKVPASNYQIETDGDTRVSIYDPNSLMHYSADSAMCFVKQEYMKLKFCEINENSNDGCHIPKEMHCDRDRDDHNVGQRKKLSQVDIDTLSAMYCNA